MMKKMSFLIAGIISATTFSTQSYAALQDSQSCEVLREEVTEDEDYGFKYINPYSVEGCDLGFDFPGVSFDITMGGLDFCSMAKSVTSSARENWNEKVDEINEWTNNSVDASVDDGVSLNGEEALEGAGEYVDGGGYSSTYSTSYDDEGNLCYTGASGNTICN